MVNGKQEGKPNHFIVITLYQQQPSDFTYSLIKKNLGILNTKIISWNWKLVIQFWHSAFKRLHWAFKTAPLSVNEIDLWWIFIAFWPKNSSRKVLSQSQINNRGRQCCQKVWAKSSQIFENPKRPISKQFKNLKRPSSKASQNLKISTSKL